MGHTVDSIEPSRSLALSGRFQLRPFRREGDVSVDSVGGADVLHLLRQFANPNVPEMDGRSLGFQAKITFGRIAIASSRDLLAIYPQANFTIDGADIVLVPLLMPLGEFFAWKAPSAIRGNRREWFHRRPTNSEDVAIGSKPIGRFS